MKTANFNIQQMSDLELIESTDRLVRQENELLTEILRLLREVERRRLFSDLKFGSLFEYAVKRLGYSEDQAYRRISAMRLLKELPELEEKIASGVISLSNINHARTLFRKEEKVCARAFTKTEKLAVVERLEGKSSREAEKIIFSLSSRPESLRPETSRVTGDDRIELRFSITSEVNGKFEKLKNLLAHSCPGISMAGLLEKLCDLGLEKFDPSTPKKKSSGNTLPATSRVTVRHRKAVPARIRRGVWTRDKGKCQSCGSEYALELDHIKPVALGGSGESENLRLLCRACNQRAAIVILGQKTLDLYLNQ